MAGRRGILFLVVGPSGVGKDSLINGARRLLEDDVGYWFPTRFITRPADAGGEAHQPITFDDLDRLAGESAFLLSWRSHGHGYGIPIAAGEALRRGRSVIVNVSRQVIPDARQHWSPVRVMLITRGRETMADIERRLDRIDAYEVAGGDVREVVNADQLDQATDRFVAMIEYELQSWITAPEMASAPSG